MVFEIDSSGLGQADAVGAGQSLVVRVGGFKMKGDNDEPTNETAGDLLGTTRSRPTALSARSPETSGVPQPCLQLLCTEKQLSLRKRAKASRPL